MSVGRTDVGLWNNQRAFKECESIDYFKPDSGFLDYWPAVRFQPVRSEVEFMFCVYLEALL